MKKSVLAILITLLIFYPFSFVAEKRATAETVGSYAYVPNSSVRFYSEEAEGRLALFSLPESYYVRILTEEGAYYRVEYMTSTPNRGITGYCLKSDLIPVPYAPVSPYPNATFFLTYRLSDENATGSLSRITVECVCYGLYEDGKYCYVYRDGAFGYVPTPLGFVFPKNTEYADYLASQEPTPVSDPPEPEKSTSPSQIVLIVLLCILIPTLTALILRPSKQNDDPSNP